MAIDFPASPTLNQTFASGSTTWRWNGSSWVAVPQTITASGLGLGNVENTALSTWAGSSNLTTLGTVGTGTWNATNIGLSKGGTNANLTAVNGGVAYSSASALALTAAGTSGNVLVSNGAAAPSWASGLALNAQQALLINPYGSGAGQTSELRFGELAASGTNYVGFKAPDNIVTNKIWTLPSVDGSTGNLLQTNGSGTLSWAPDNYPCQGRLTLTSATPVTTSDVTAAGTVYFTPYLGNVIGLWNTTTSKWDKFNFSELSASLASFSGDTNIDFFVYNNAGTPALFLATWSSNTARATALATQNGILVASGSPQYRYVGTVRTTVTAAQTADSQSLRLVWNQYNRVIKSIRRAEPTASWTYGGAGSTVQRYQFNNSDNRIDVVCGESQGIFISIYCDTQRNATGSTFVGINYQTTNVTGSPGALAIVNATAGSNANMLNIVSVIACSYSTQLPIGYGSFGAIEWNNGTGFTTSFIGSSVRQGLNGVWAC